MTDCKYALLSPQAGNAENDLLKDKTEEDGLRRIQALLADWLRMENIVVLTAAGTSVGAGGRLMTGPKANNLECLVLDTVKHKVSVNAQRLVEWKQNNPGGFEEWLSFLFSIGSLPNREKSPIDAITWKHPTTGGAPVAITSDELRNLQKYISRAIYAECDLSLGVGEIAGAASKGADAPDKTSPDAAAPSASAAVANPSKEKTPSTSGHLPFLAKLVARDPNLGRVHLFTLNYDTLFEQALEELGIQYSDGFSGKVNARFDPAVYGLDLYYPGEVAEGRVRRYDRFVQFYKLHGSLHWRPESDGIYRARYAPAADLKGYRDKVSAEKAEMLNTLSIEKFGILPTSQKFSQTLDLPYGHLFRLLHARLHQPQTFLLVMGYGFNDEHVTQVIETALMNPSLVMLVVEPARDSKIVKSLSRYMNLGQRVFVLTERKNSGTFSIANFADFAQNVMPDVKWLEDYKRLRQFEAEMKKADNEMKKDKDSPDPLRKLSGEE